MSTERALKVNASHLQRDAYLYVRQSTLRQVLENTESTQRQYQLTFLLTAAARATSRLVPTVGLSSATPRSAS